MTTPARIIRYLRDCYEADNRDSAVFNLSHEKVQHVHFLSQGIDFLRGLLDVVPVDRESAVAAQKAADLYATEKALIFCAFMIVGQIKKTTPRIPAKIFAPLVFFPAIVRDEGTHACLTVELRQQRINARVLSALLGELDSTPCYLDELLCRIPQAPFETHQIAEITSVFEEFLPDIDMQDLYQFPHAVSEAIVTKAARSGPNTPCALKCYPACAMALIPNSPDTRGVLSELAQIATAPSRSTPLKLLLGSEEPPAAASRRPLTIHVPASLSAAQQKSVLSAASHPLTLIIGPPGTGKSYTVATLALDHVLRGRSVLVASKMNQALDVLAQKIKELAGEASFIVRGGRMGYSRQLKDSLGMLLQGMDRGTAGKETSSADIRCLSRQIARQRKAIEKLEGILEIRAAREFKWGQRITESCAPGLLSRLLKNYELRVTEWQLDRHGFYWDLVADYQRNLHEYHRNIARYLGVSVQHRLQRALHRHRPELITLSKALRARTNQKQEELFETIDLKVLLHTFPVWMTTLADVGDLLPLKPELFDLAIVDEATQCDMASCLPVFFRARRVAITGDPQQLRHVSFLSRERQRLIAQQWEVSDAQQERCNYREKSILDLVNESVRSQEQVTFLDEHFRSRPPIIAFSNREFYHGALKVMTERPEMSRQPSVIFRHVAGHREPGGANREEARQLVSEVERWIESEKLLSQSMAHSLGVLSPFREQVDHILTRLSKRIQVNAIEKHRLIVGTAHSFQGEERDVMFLSFAVDPHAHVGSLRYLNRPDVFNVSITRARNMQFVFCSLRPDEINERSLFRRYLEAIDGAGLAAAANASADAFLQETKSALESIGFITWPAYPVAGLTIDLLVERDGATLGIDLIGYPGPYAKAFDLEKYRMFERAGLRIFPLSYSAWCKDRQVCLDAIQQWTAGNDHGPKPKKL